MTRIKLENVMPRERSQARRTVICHDSSYLKCGERANPQRQKADRSLPGDRHRRELGGTGIILGVIEIFWNETAVMGAQHCKCTKNTLKWLSGEF